MTVCLEVSCLLSCWLSRLNVVFSALHLVLSCVIHFPSFMERLKVLVSLGENPQKWDWWDWDFGCRILSELGAK